MTFCFRSVAFTLTFAALGLVNAQPVNAQTAAAEPSGKSATGTPSRFSVGAGIGISYDLGGAGISGLGGFGALGSSSAGGVTPIGTALFEWALSRSLRLMVGALGSYSKRINTSMEERENTADSRWTAGGGVGLRWVVNPGGVVEISPALLIGVHGGKVNQYQSGDSAGSPTVVDSASFGLDARLGFVLEHALLSQLYLRFETYVLRGGADWNATRDDLGRVKRGDAGLGWGISPMLQLRLTI